MTTTAREWLATKGLAIAGARGKLSKDAHAALNKALSEGMEFSDWDQNGKVKAVPGQRAAKPAVVTKRVTADSVLIAAKPVRDQNLIRVVDQYGYTIHVDHCAQCCNSVRFCRCSKGPWVSDFLFREAQSICFVTRELV